MLLTANFRPMENRRNFNEIQKRVNLYLDKELSKDAEKELLHQMETDTNIREILEAEQGFRELLRKKVKKSYKKNITPSFIDTIKNNIKIP